MKAAPATMPVGNAERLRGLLLGTAVGDALGLPAEGISPARIRRWWGGEWRMRLVFGRGMVSDDTEHMLFVAAALCEHADDANGFQRALAGRLRWWFLALPAGVGMATARACIKLWLGVSPETSGVFSAGNGPAMRSAIIGAHFKDAPDKRRDFVRASTRLTHTDPKAEAAALAVAECAAWAAADSPAARDLLVAGLRDLSPDAEWRRALVQMEEHLGKDAETHVFAASLGLTKGVSGYAFHTVPVAIYAWLRHRDDFRAALTSALDCGGDTDTVGAIVGALSGATLGPGAIPEEWLARLCDFPNSRSAITRCADGLARGDRQSAGPQALARLFSVPRNLLFLVIVLTHGFRRLFPPY
jgi:ADP-ribosylglycohydrolase